MNDKQLLELNSNGLIPGPDEEEKEFLARVNYSLTLKDHLPFTSFYPTQTIADVVLNSLEKTKQFFDIQPYWVPVQVNNYQLRPWHGGAAWIFQETEDHPVSAFIQFRKVFNFKKKYLGIYEFKELIDHELAHVGRMMFEEPKFEEILAYRTSTSWFRRFFGPIIQSSSESMLFMLSLFIIMFFDFFLIMYNPENYMYYNFLKIIPLGVVVFGVVRLCSRQRTYNKTLNKLKKIAKSEDVAEAVIYRLKDAEIERFSKLSPQTILDIITEEKDNSLRFRVIHLAYIA